MIRTTPRRPAAAAACASLLLLSLSLLTIESASAQAAAFTQIERGRYLARVGDCAGCHTADPARPYAGGEPVPTPFGTIWSTNITPDKLTGIGDWSDHDFYRAMHHGIDDKGRNLYPAFPYPWFTKMARADVDAVRAFLRTLQPIHNEVKQPDLPWPLSVRKSVAAWNALFLKEGEFRSDASKSAVWNRGAYLVEGPGHCGACHTPKNVLGATKKSRSLEGGDAGEHWYAPSLTRSLHEGIGGWSVDEIVEYLKTGANAKSAAAGSMKDVIRASTQHLTRADLTAIAVYLKDVPAAEPQGSAAASGGGDTTLAKESNDGHADPRGEAIYIDNCSGCHMAGGEGIPNVFPPLRGSSAIVARNADTLVHVILAGQAMVETKAKPTGLAMPAYADKLTDRDIAGVVSYIRNAWGNRASSVDADDVAKVREVAKPIGDGYHEIVDRRAALSAPRR